MSEIECGFMNPQYINFYNENNIEVIDRENPELNMKIIENTSFIINGEVYKKYSVNSWISDLIEIK